MSLGSPLLLFAQRIMSSLFEKYKSIELFLFFDSIITVEFIEMSAEEVKSDDLQITQQNYFGSCFGLGDEN